jgi:hypothetical protein
MAGRRRTRRAAELVDDAVALLRTGGRAWTEGELLAALGVDDEVEDWEQAAGRMAMRDLRRRPDVVSDAAGRVSYLPLADSNGAA